MSWKRVKPSALSLPTRQELLIVGTSLIMGLIVITYFVLRN